MACYKLWLHPLHQRRSHGPLHIDEMQRAESHDERIAVLREVCCEASKGSVDVAQLTEAILHSDALVARSEKAGNPTRLPLHLSQVCEYDISESTEKRSDNVLGYVAYACPMTAYTAREQECEVSKMTQGDVWVFIVTGGAPCATSANKTNSVLSQAMGALTSRGAISADTSAFEALGERAEKGGFGTVRFFKRRHDVKSSTYAGKLLDDDQAMSACVESEYLLAGRNHPNIVAFIGTFCFVSSSEERKWMIVTEGHLGGDIESRVRRYGAFSDRDALQVSIGVLKALSHLHEHGIMHRDVKPANVVLASDGRAVLIDMGLAVHVSESAKLKKRCGTPGFTAPEILLRRGCEFKSDVFGCGALLYFAVSGMSPFPGANKDDTMTLNARARIDFDDKRFLTINVHTIEIMRVMLQKKPRRRPTARSACNSMTLVTEMALPAELPEDTSNMVGHTLSKQSTASGQSSTSTWQSIRGRFRAFSGLKTDDVLNSFSSASTTPTSACSSASERGQKPVAKEKKKGFFLKARTLLGRVKQLKQTHTEVTSFVGVDQIRGDDS